MRRGFYFGRCKSIIKRVPGIQRLARLKNDIVRINEISNLIKDNKIVVLHPFFKMQRDLKSAQEVIYDVVRDLLDVYGTIRLRKETVAATECQAGVILLYAPLALLRIPSSHEEYLSQVGNKTRNMIRKSIKYGYKFESFSWNDHMDAIYEINKSKEVRQSTSMRGWYRDKVQPRYHSKEEQGYRKYYGAFKDGRLCAYLHVVLCGDFAFFRHFIGHAQHLSNGVMNGLLSWTIGEYVGNPQILWLKYGELSKTPSTMHQFRKHTGFQGFATFLDIDGDRELVKCADEKVRSKWRL